MPSGYSDGGQLDKGQGMNRAFEDYKVLGRAEWENLATDVRHDLLHGWEPLGGVSVVMTGAYRTPYNEPPVESHTMFYQAMVRYA